MSLRKNFLFYFLCFLSIHPQAFCAGTYEKLVLTGINIVDRNGLSETIGSKDKLRHYAKINFLSPQPYQKVMRIYKNTKGESVACLTTYHSNGQLKQYLECVNNRANGRYREWHANGKLKIHARVIGGIADLHPSAEVSWLFHGRTLAYNDEETLEACIHYDKGSLEGLSFYYHPNGNIWKSCSYHKNLPHGEFLTFTPNNQLLKKQNYEHGVLHGPSYRYSTHSEPIILSQEEYDQGALISGVYFCPETKNKIAEVVNGEGTQMIYGRYAIVEKRTITKGQSNGEVVCFDAHGQCITQTYSLYNGLKHGEEYFFYPDTSKPKLMLTWYQGILQGSVKTWYPSGSLESCKELINNKKSGILTVYYPEGQIMATEEYDNELLVKGEYFRLGDRLPYSKVDRGCGTAVFFTTTGIVSKKIIYQDGKPLIQNS